MFGGNYEAVGNPQNLDDFYAPPPPAPLPPAAPPSSQAPSTEPHAETFASTTSNSGGVVQRKKSQVDLTSKSNSIDQRKEGKGGSDEEILGNPVFRYKLALRTCYALWISILVTSLISFAIAILLFFAL
ncbi:unnamed protein product [Bursaphelenchus xylophilus]|uniref:(pine wood nematode) hypothetical protein n=1 Tax=Bursaphelenchus xylophilus TaxID=6326 RepID=A0A1I7RRK4_BURXY|nr:unnamed protein product [Bursaphelenchus xylophilus]CAG9131087.1 unnamed protein product [Bursaphelenchus xylophilus]